MLKKIKSIYNNHSVIYLFASIVGFGIPFVQNFLFAVLLSANQYGELVFFISIFGMLSAFFGFGIGSLIQRYYYDNEQEELLQQVFSFWLVCGLALIILFLVIGAIIFAIIQDAPFAFSDYVLIVISSFLFSINLTFLNLYIVSKKPVKYALHLILGRLFLFLALLTVYFFIKNTIVNYIFAYAIASVIICLGTLLDFKINPLKKIKLSIVKEFFMFSYPLMINTMGSLGYSHGYKVLLKMFLSYSELGIFNIASSLANSFYLVSSSMLKGYIPKAFEYLKENVQKRNILFYRKKITLIAMASFILFVPASILFLKIFKEGEYLEAIYILPILFLAQILLLFYGERNLVFVYLKKTKFITASVITGSFVSVFLLFVFMKFNNLLAFAALPILIGYILQYCIATYYSRKA